MFYGFVYLFLFLIFLFSIVSITWSSILYLFSHFGSFNIWICVTFCNIWTCLTDFNNYTKHDSFEGNQFFFYISLLCNHMPIFFFLFQILIGSKSYDSLILISLSLIFLCFECVCVCVCVYRLWIFWFLSIVIVMDYSFQCNPSFSYICCIFSHTYFVLFQ